MRYFHNRTPFRELVRFSSTNILLVNSMVSEQFEHEGCPDLRRIAPRSRVLVISQTVDPWKF